MRRDPSSKLYGVREYKGQFIAQHIRQGKQTTIGIYSTARAAGEAHDQWAREHLPFSVAYEQLNYKNESDEKRLEGYIQQQLEKRTRDVQLREAYRRSNLIVESDHKRLLKLYNSGESIAEIAIAFETHPDNVIMTLRHLKEAQMQAIGLGGALDQKLTAETIKNHVSFASRAGESIREISARLGLGRKTISKLIDSGSEVEED